MAGTFVWQPANVSICPINAITEGQFEKQSGANGIAGAIWCLFDDGTLEVSEGFINWTGSLSPWHNYRDQITEINFTGLITAGTSLQSLFSGLSNVMTIEGLELFDTSNATNMSSMFANSTSLTAIDLSMWNTSQVIDMNMMFAVTHNLVKLDVSNWDTSQVTNMSWMFAGDVLGAHSLSTLDVSSWDTSQVTNMSGMFWAARSLTDLNVSNWDTSQVTDMSWMFSGTISLRELTLGEQFRFVGNPGLQEVWQTADFTGFWQNVGAGTRANPTGQFVLTSSQLMAQFNGATMADTFVWQPTNEPLINTLRELIAEAEARIQSNYTPRSWADMMSRLTFARNVYNNPTAIDSHYNEAINLLRAALDALVER